MYTPSPFFNACVTSILFESELERDSIGFTGTRKGMTPLQLDFLSKVLATRRDKKSVFSILHEVHHGSCIGADNQFHTLALHYSKEVHVHPSNLTNLTAECFGNVDYPAKSPLERNRDIVEACCVLIACPDTHEERKRSGTWATIRYANSAGVSVLIIYPDGTYNEFLAWNMQGS